MLWFWKWYFTWSLEWRSCLGRVMREKAWDGELFAGCRGAPSTCIAHHSSLSSPFLKLKQKYDKAVAVMMIDLGFLAMPMYHYARSHNRQPWCHLFLSLWLCTKTCSLSVINTQMSLFHTTFIQLVWRNQMKMHFKAISTNCCYSSNAPHFILPFNFFFWVDSVIRIWLGQENWYRL